MSRFCDLYRAWKKQLDVSLRQDYVGGERLFVDYAGATVDVVDPRSGEVRAAQIFVAVLGASNYTYAEATWSQDLRDWIGSHVRAFEAIGGVVEHRFHRYRHLKRLSEAEVNSATPTLASKDSYLIQSFYSKDPPIFP